MSPLKYIDMSLPLKIGILSFKSSRKKDKDSVAIKNAAIAMGHTARIFRNANFQFSFDPNKPNLFYKNQKFSPPDVMIVRASVLENVDLEVSSVKQFQLMGVPVVNHYLPIVRAKNKVRTMQILKHEGIPIPRTIVVHNLEYLDEAVNQIGSFPLILKTPNGSLGLGVSIIESRRSLRSMTDLISGSLKEKLIIIQEYVKEAKGKDIRVFVVGGKIIAAMERQAKRGEFRANFHQGGSVALADLSEEEQKMSLAATKAIGLHVAGVDIIRTTEGPKILEVNSNPGLEGITQATGVNVAYHIAKFAEKLVKQKKWLIQKDDAMVAA